MNTVDKICGGSFILVFMLIICLGVGWVMNCVQFARLDFKQPIKAEVLRGIGLFPPIGAVMGWVPIDDTPEVKPVD